MSTWFYAKRRQASYSQYNSNSYGRMLNNNKQKNNNSERHNAYAYEELWPYSESKDSEIRE